MSTSCPRRPRRCRGWTRTPSSPGPASIGGPIFLILFTALDWSPIPYATFFAIAAFVGGFGSLVYRMKDDPPNYGDDGAIV